MTIELIDGDFQPKEAIEILTKLIHVKVKFLLDKSNTSSNRVDINKCETHIKALQKQLFEVKKSIDNKNGPISIKSSIIL